MSCSRTQCSAAGEARTSNPSISSQALYHWATGARTFSPRTFWPGTFRPRIFRPQKVPKVDILAITINFGLGCMHAFKCAMHFLIFWNQICKWILTIDSKMHGNRIMLFLIETSKLWCILYSSKWYISV